MRLGIASSSRLARMTQEPPLERAIFLSDVHLSAERPELTRRFLAFLDGLRGNASRLYLLGDVFDYWIGPAHLLDPEHRDTLVKLRQLTGEGMEVHFVHGNRDFHVARDFARATGVRVMGDAEAAEFGRERVWLIHGDQFCTADVRYHVWRRISRARWALALYRALPHWVTREIARRARGLSRRGPARVRASGFTPAAVRRVFRQGFDRIICGHLHRAGTRTFDLAGRTGTLMVLGEWNGVGSYIEWDGEAFRHREVSLLEAPNPA